MDLDRLGCVRFFDLVLKKYACFFIALNAFNSYENSTQFMAFILSYRSA